MRPSTSSLSVLALLLVLTACTAGGQLQPAAAPTTAAPADGAHDDDLGEAAQPTGQGAVPAPVAPAPTASASAEPTPAADGSQAATPSPADGAPAAAVLVRTGADVLVEEDFARLAGLRVGIIANQTSQSGGAFLIDLLHTHPAVELAAIFAPEHGVRGDAFAGEEVGDTTDPATGVPIFSLYEQESGFKPTADELAGIDVLIYDLQDVGTRFYTYISTMGRAMEAAAESGVVFMVLDRPNPQGGDVIEGFIRTPEQDSFVSEYPIPARYGLTAGELARMIRGEGWKAVDGLALEVVPMVGWDRSMRWGDTGLEWVPPSFGLPTAETALVYPGTVLFETLTYSFGAGTVEPFVRIGAPWADADALASELNGRGLAGVAFRPITYVPEPHPERPQYADRIRFLGETVRSVRVEVTDADVLSSVAVGIHMVDAFRRHAQAMGQGEAIERAAFFDLLAGTAALRSQLEAGAGAAAIVAASAGDAAAFDGQRQPYLLY